jgi:hypothetical protein
VPCPDVVRWVSASRPSGGKAMAARLRVRDTLPAAQTGFKGRLRVFTFHNVSNPGILVTISYLAVFKAISVNILILVVVILR